jgi:hypothetical protein
MPAVSAIYPKAAQGATRTTHRQRTADSSLARAVVQPLIPAKASDPAPKAFKPLDGACWRGIPAADTYHYFDTVKYLSKRRIPESGEALLRAHSKHLDIRRHGEWVFPKNGKPYQINIWPWLFRIEIQVPDQAALEYLAKRRGLKLTRADPARDFTFDHLHEKDRAFDFLSEHFVQSRQSKKRQRMTFDNGGLSTGRRHRGHYFTFYSSRECRIDGIAECLHQEGRYLGTKALGQIGLHHPRDLLRFDHAEYWSGIEHQLLTIDKERLGRNHTNRYSGERRQQSDQMPFYGRTSEDLWRGSLLYRIHAIDQWGNFSVDQFIRSYGRRGAFVISLGNGTSVLDAG